MNFLSSLFLTILGGFSNLFGSNNFEPTVQLSITSQVRYDNYSVYEILLHSERQRAMFKEFTMNISEYDIWERSGNLFHIMLGPNHKTHFQGLIRNGGYKSNLLIPNVQRLIDREQTTMQGSGSLNFDWNHYNTLDDINVWLNNITAAYSKVAEIFTVGTSFEGRRILGIKISHKSNNPGIFIESNIHAREWITSATATWLINELLTSTRIEVRHLARNYDWYIVPVLNVDGFVYSHTTDRLWRRTRHPVSNNSSCVGVDANRNYDDHWNENGGASNDPCSETFAGPFPFSEPEVRGLATYVQSIKNKINILFAFHSYGQNLLSPFGYTNSKKPDNYKDLMQIGHAYADSVFFLPYGTRFKVGSTSERLYIASGCTSDWAYSQGINITYTIEFRDTGRHGFILPPEFIIPNGQETLAGIFGLVAEAERLGYMRLKYNSSSGISRIGDVFDWGNWFGLNV